MQPRPFAKQFTFRNGYFPSQQDYEGVPDTALAGINVWLRGQIMVSDRGATAQGTGSGGAVPLMLVGAQHGGPGGGLGTVTLHSSVVWAATNASTIIVNGVSLGVGTTKLCLVVGGTVYEAGLSTPSAPTWTAAVTAGRLKGSTSIRLAKFRQTTGAISNVSPPTAAMLASLKKGVIGTLANPGDGTTHWLVYASRNNFGGIGPWFRATNVAAIPVATLAAGPVEIDFTDGQLGDLAPITNDPAPVCTHCAGLGAVMCAIGSFGGYAISPSKVGQPEAYDVGLTSFLASREPITGISGRGVEGGIFVATRNSISLIILSGSPDVPVLPRGVFENTGVAHGNAMCWAYDALYGFGSTGGPFRSQGSAAPDVTFALPVIKRMLDLGMTSANTFVIHDERNGAVLYTSGNRVFPFMLATQRWSAEIAVAGTVTACVAIGGVGLLAVGSTLYSLDSANSTPLGGWFLQSPYLGEDGAIMTAEAFYAQAKDNMTLDLFGDLGGVTIGGKFPLSFIAPHGTPKVQKPNRRARSLALKASASGGGQSFYKATVVGTVEPSAA